MLPEAFKQLLLEKINQTIQPTCLPKKTVLLLGQDNELLLNFFVTRYPQTSWQPVTITTKNIDLKQKKITDEKVVAPCCWALDQRNTTNHQADAIIIIYPIHCLRWQEVKNLFFYCKHCINSNGLLIIGDYFIDPLKPISQTMNELNKTLRNKNKDYSVRDLNVTRTLGSMNRFKLSYLIQLQPDYHLLTFNKLPNHPAKKPNKSLSSVYALKP